MSHRIIAVELYPEATVAELRSLTTLGQQQLSTTGSSWAFMSSPGWVVGASLVAGLLENATTSAAQREGLNSLQKAAELRNSLRWLGHSFRIDEIQNLDLPKPPAWTAIRKDTRPVDLRSLTHAESRQLFLETGLTVHDANDHRLSVPTETRHVGLDDEFISVVTEDERRLKVRWASLGTFRAVVDDRDVQAVPPSAPTYEPVYFLG